MVIIVFSCICLWDFDSNKNCLIALHLVQKTIIFEAFVTLGNFVVTQVAYCETWDLLHWATFIETCPAAMVKKRAEQWHYNNISWKKLEGVILLDDATEHCRDAVTLSNNWKFCCSVTRSWFLLLATIAASKKLWGMSVAG